MRSNDQSCIFFPLKKKKRASSNIGRTRCPNLGKLGPRACYDLSRTRNASLSRPTFPHLSSTSAAASTPQRVAPHIWIHSDMPLESPSSRYKSRIVFGSATIHDIPQITTLHDHGQDGIKKESFEEDFSHIGPVQIYAALFKSASRIITSRSS